MAERAATERWLYRLAYLGLAGCVVFLHILPIEVGPDGYPGPDLLICLTFAWVLRRPGDLPPGLIALVFLATDFLFMRPPGLWAALVVLGTEFLRIRQPATRDMPFLAEWAMVGGVLVAMVLTERLVLTVFMVDLAGFGLAALQLAATVLVYPIVVLLARYGMGLRRPMPGETDALGRPL